MKIPKAYRYYKLEDLANILHISDQTYIDMLEPLLPAEPSDFLKELIRRNLPLPMPNEKAKSELLIMPILFWWKCG